MEGEIRSSVFRKSSKKNQRSRKYSSENVIVPKAQNYGVKYAWYLSQKRISSSSNQIRVYISTLFTYPAGCFNDLNEKEKYKSSCNWKEINEIFTKKSKKFFSRKLIRRARNKDCERKSNFSENWGKWNKVKNSIRETKEKNKIKELIMINVCIYFYGPD